MKEMRGAQEICHRARYFHQGEYGFSEGSYSKMGKSQGTDTGRNSEGCRKRQKSICGAIWKVRKVGKVKRMKIINKGIANY